MRPRMTTWDWVKKRATLVLPRGRFARSVITLAGGTALGQAIAVLGSPVLTRLYTPDDFGILAIYSSALGIVSVIASLRYELAIPLPDDDKDATALLALSLGIVAVISLLTGFGVWLLGEQITRWANASALHPYLWLLPLGVGIVGTYQVFNYWAVRKHAFGQIATTRLHQSIGTLVTQIGLGLLKIEALGLLGGKVIGQGIGIMILASLAKRTVNSISFADIGRVARRYYRFPLLSSFSGLLNSMGLRLPVLLLATFYGPQVAGWFALGQKVVGLPMGLLGQAVAQVYLAIVSRLLQENNTGIEFVFLKAARRLLFWGSIPIVMLILTGPWLFSFVFGAEWREAGSYVQLLAIMFLFQFVIVPLSQTMNVLEKQDLQFIWDCGRLVLVVGTIWGIWQLGGTAKQAVAGLSLAASLAYLALFCLNLRSIKIWETKYNRSES